jgi:hypothetical protein
MMTEGRVRLDVRAERNRLATRRSPPRSTRGHLGDGGLHGFA